MALYVLYDLNCFMIVQFETVYYSHNYVARSSMIYEIARTIGHVDW